MLVPRLPATINAVRHGTSMVKRIPSPEVDDLMSTLLTPQNQARFIENAEKMHKRKPKKGRLGPRPRSKGDSAVLVGFVHREAVLSSKNPAERQAQPWTLLTHRSYLLRNHRGELCFPGGRLEEGESMVEGALRETEEEIALPANEVDVWGIAPGSLTRSLTHNVFPVVGVIGDHALTQVRPTDDEVQAVFLVPLSDFLNSSFYTYFRHKKVYYRLPVFKSANYLTLSTTPTAYHNPDRVLHIWGLSALLMSQVMGALVPELWKPY